MVPIKVCFSCVWFLGLLLVFSSCENHSTTKQLPLLDSAQSQNTFIGSEACKQCHSSEYKDWLSSDHYLAMQEAKDSTVLGRFNSSSFTLDGVTNQLVIKDNQYLLKTKEINNTQNTYTLSYTFGYFPLQQYLVKTERGQLQATRLSWDSRNQKWFHQYPGQKIHPGDWLHWTGNSQNWNTMCASCHSTNFKKNYDFESDTYSSTYSEINVACESCHGAGASHLAYLQSEAYRKGERIFNSGFRYGKDKNNRLQLNTCAPCHARKSDISSEITGGSELLDDFIPELISNEHYFADGQINNEDYEYGSFAQSKMFHNKVKCSDCHNPHSGKLRKEGNAMCLSCHKPQYDSEQHHFHKGKGESTQCINCHMPQKTYMGNDHRRDHSFRIPRPDQSAIYKTPNTCNTCHSKQSAKWAAESIKKWYGNKRAYHFSDDLLPGSLLNADSQPHLTKLIADTSQPEIARATAIYYLRNFQNQEALELLLKYSKDEKALVRFHAIRSLENYPTDVWAPSASHGLYDKVRAIRIATADLYHLAGANLVPAAAKKAYVQADAENQSYLRYQRDFAIGNVMMADYHLQESDYKNAIIHYLRGLKKDSLMNYARLNLSKAYNGLQLNRESLKTLKDAETIDPNNAAISYNLALLYYETGELENSDKAFKKAIRSEQAEAEVYYNYGLFLQQKGNSAEAEQMLLSGYKRYPSSEKLNYAISYFYLTNQNYDQAKKYAISLFQADPDNNNYQPLFKQLGLLK